MSEEEAMLWQDALEEILAGRVGNTSCPHCGAAPLTVDETGPTTKVTCKGCGAFIEGQFGGLN